MGQYAYGEISIMKDRRMGNGHKKRCWPYGVMDIGSNEQIGQSLHKAHHLMLISQCQLIGPYTHCSICPLPNAHCPTSMPIAPCLLPDAHCFICPLPDAHCPILNLRCMLPIP